MLFAWSLLSALFVKRVYKKPSSCVIFKEWVCSSLFRVASLKYLLAPLPVRSKRLLASAVGKLEEEQKMLNVESRLFQWMEVV